MGTIRNTVRVLANDTMRDLQALGVAHPDATIDGLMPLVSGRFAWLAYETDTRMQAELLSALDRAAGLRR